MIGYELFQLGYVTRDAERASADFGARQVAGRFVTYIPEFRVVRAGLSGVAVLKQGIGWSSGIMYELIQPVCGLVDIYTDALPADDSVRFHHVAYIADDWDATRQRIAEEGWPIAFEGENDTARFIYIDARQTVGHYLEYVWMAPESLAIIRGMKHTS